MIILYVLLILAVGRIVYILEPWGISVDESTYMAVAEAWDRYGKLYVDAIDRKPPLVYGFYYVIGNLFGFWNLHGVHFVFFLLAFALCMIAEKVAQALPHPPRKGTTAILFAVISACFSREFICSNSEMALLLPLGLSFWILVHISQKKLPSLQMMGFIFLSAALAATATLLKQIAALPYAFAISLWCLYLLKDRAFTKVTQISLSVIAGVLFVYALTALCFYWAGSFDDFVYWNLTDNFAYIKDAKLLDQSARPIFSPVLVTLATWPILWWALTRKKWTFNSQNSNENHRARAVFLILLGGFIGGYAIVYVSGRLFSHYFVPAAWLFTIFVAKEVDDLLQNRKWATTAIVSLTVPFMICFALITFRDPLFAYLAPNKKVHTFDLKTQDRLLRVAKKIEDQSNDGDRIVVWGMASQLYIMSQRGSGTRFIPADYVSGRLGGFSSPAKRPAPQAMELYLKDLEAKKPKFFIDTATAGMNDYQYFPITNYPELIAYLEKNYTRSENIEGFDFWKRKD